MAVVLVVDDGAANRQLVQAYLSGIDCDVRMAENGESALEQIKADPPDLVLLDVQMPGLDGYEVCRRIKAGPRGRLLPVVMITALNQTDDRVRAHVSVLDVVQVHRPAVAVRAALGLSVELGHHLVRVCALRERVPVRAVRRHDDVAVFERAADADGNRLLADGDVQEARELACAETVLDLLLEPPDQEHLTEEVPQIALRERPPLLDFRQRYAPGFAGVRDGEAGGVPAFAACFLDTICRSLDSGP